MKNARLLSLIVVVAPLGASCSDDAGGAPRPDAPLMTADAGAGADGGDAGPADAGERPPDGPEVDATPLDGASPDAPGLPDGPALPDGAARDGIIFTVFGDMRPSVPNATSSWPAAIVNQNLTRMAATPAVFAVATGDYSFATTTAAVTAQFGMLLAAERAFGARPIYHVMGNHECQNTVDVNCPNFNESPQVQAYMSMLAGHPQPWFTVLQNGRMGMAKFIFVAANAWTSEQATWLRQQLAIPTRYTFIVRHEPTESSTATVPGVPGSDAVLRGVPVTLYLFGHKHTYQHYAPNQVISGNSGAPLDGGGTYYGFVLVQERADGNIAVTAYDSATGMPTDSWAVTPAGAPTR
jgi:hypothetical protein